MVNKIIHIRDNRLVLIKFIF
nr:unnamed protein product [Callosobruchus analis]